MKKLLGITLGIMTALGGFVDIGQIVFTMQAGALFRYQLLWSVLLGTAGIILYMEMCGRIAVVRREPVFSIVRQCLGYRGGLVVLIASNLLNLITCAAELAGIAIVLRLLTGAPERLLLTLAGLVLGGAVFLLEFKWIERVFGLAGLLMTIFAVSAVVLRPDWNLVVRGLLPTFSNHASSQIWLYLYFAVGIFSAMLMVYEVHFYSSGAIEEGWKPKDLAENFAVASAGSVLGALLTCALLILAVLVFLPRGVFPESISVTVLPAALPFGRIALILALCGVLACLSGAAVETMLSGAYNLCQFYSLPWSKSEPPRKVRVFSITWLAMLVLALGLALSGIPALTLVNVSIIFGMLVLPFTYYPILRVAGDRKLMGQHVNSRPVTILGLIFLGLICVAAVAALPLMFATGFGKP
jgi:Mn2+/Fe2+ NRAMP family transporter